MVSKIFEFDTGPELRYFLRGVEFASAYKVTKVTIKNRFADQIVELEYEDDTTTRENGMAGPSHDGSDVSGDVT